MSNTRLKSETGNQKCQSGNVASKTNKFDPGQSVQQADAKPTDPYSAEVRDLLKQLLMVDQDLRPSADNVKLHPWFD